jgi:hypothetical protein
MSLSLSHLEIDHQIEPAVDLGEGAVSGPAGTLEKFGSYFSPIWTKFSSTAPRRTS